MDRTAHKLGGRSLTLVPANVSPLDAYGCWNSLVAFDRNGATLGSVSAHDGDFFPESPADYVAVMRRRAKDPCVPLTPVRVDIDITQVCNAACTFCFSRPYYHGAYRGAAVSESDLRSLLSDAALMGAKTVRYCGGGDPLAHPQIRSLLGLPRDYGLKLCVITNGDFLNVKLAELFVQNVDHVRWSVNAASDQTRRAIHRPNRSAAPLSQTRRWIQFMAVQANTVAPIRRPMIWATYLILPENVHEMEAATAALRSAGVRSVSFRPVFHGLHTEWTSQKRMLLEEAIAAVRCASNPPEFFVFTPKRDVTAVDELNPNAYFSDCVSRRLRTVIEASADGARLQPCGVYRGNPQTARLLPSGRMRMRESWDQSLAKPIPHLAPQDCQACIDVSMNQTLAFIADVLARDSDAEFLRASVDSPVGSFP